MMKDDIAWPPKNINKVAVFGMARSGKSALKLALKTFSEVFAINQGKVEDWAPSLGIDGFSQTRCFSQAEFNFSEMDLIILSPGISLSVPELSNAQKKNVPIISEIEFAWLFSQKVPVIAITGTNGKTTTTTMIAEFLKRSGKKVFCGGNIGIPYSEMILSGESYDLAVIEVSSFQLETIKSFHPKIALILNIFPNHSERYSSVEDYAAAKYRLIDNLTHEDTLILGEDNAYLSSLPKTKARKLLFRKGSLPPSFHQSFSFKNSRLPGAHNQANFYAAYLALESLGIPGMEEKFQTFINEFSGVAHRLEFVREWEGLKIYNDAKSTNMLATTTALNAFEGVDDIYLILGGKIRDPKDLLLPDLQNYHQRVKKIFAIGEAGKKISKELGELFSVHEVGDLSGMKDELIRSKPQGILIFSPGFPSFDQFKNFEDRGEKFKEMIRKL